MHALTAAFGERLARGQFPAAVLWVEVDPSKVDVNVHPTKREVRFENGGAVHDFVMHAVRKSLDARAGEVFAHAPCGKSGVEAAIMRYEQKRLDSGLETRDAGFERPGRGTRDSGLERLEFGQGFPSHESRVTSHEVFRPIGQLSSTYIICEGEGGALVLIDQHAAHEKLGFENLKRQYACGSVAVQRLLVPESVELGVKELAYVEEHLGLLDRAGFEVEPFGGNTLLVKAVPAILGDASTTPVFEELASDLENYGGSRTFDEEIERIFAVVACHAQVRAGDRLSNEEIAALVRDIERENIAHCPHGRPAVVKIEKSEIEKWFKRS
jgi:DNA mismatch repair protein MutL